MQVSRLVCKLEEESSGCAESITRKQLREKIAALPPPQLARAMDVLGAVWNGVKGPLGPPRAEPKFTFSVTPFPFPNWHRVKLALLKSIHTGTFIDIQFYAYNAVRNNVPLDPRPLFTSSIVIEEWGGDAPSTNPTLTYDRRNNGDRLPGHVSGGWASR